jgi:hypothetical protein
LGVAPIKLQQLQPQIRAREQAAEGESSASALHFLTLLDETLG